MDSFSVWHWIILILMSGAPFLILKFVFDIGAKRVAMKNASTGQIKDGFYGYSWTYLYFGWWVPLIRGELGVAALHLLFTLVTFGLWQLIVSFLFNRQYTQRLVERGFRLVEGNPKNIEAAKHLSLDLSAHLRSDPRLS